MSQEVMPAKQLHRSSLKELGVFYDMRNTEDTTLGADLNSGVCNSVRRRNNFPFAQELNY